MEAKTEAMLFTRPKAEKSTFMDIVAAAWGSMSEKCDILVTSCGSGEDKRRLWSCGAKGGKVRSNAG